MKKQTIFEALKEAGQTYSDALRAIYKFKDTNSEEDFAFAMEAVEALYHYGIDLLNFVEDVRSYEEIIIPDTIFNN